MMLSLFKREHISCHAAACLLAISLLTGCNQEKAHPPSGSQGAASFAVATATVPIGSASSHPLSTNKKEGLTNMQVNGKLDATGRVILQAGDISITVQTQHCIAEPETLQQCTNTIRLLIQGTHLPEQNLEISSLFFDSVASLYRGPLDSHTATRKHSFILSDVNNDGQEDLLIWTGKEGAYGGASFDVYLADPATGKFQYSSAFSELTIGYNGLFIIDGNKIKTVASSGCCMHIFETYEIQNNTPVLIERITEDSTNPANPTQTKETLVDGKLQEIPVK